MNRHRVSLRRPALRRHPDPTHSRDARLVAVVAGLREIEIAGPRDDFRAELRAQLVAITPRVVAEGAAEFGTPMRSRPRPRPAAAAVPARPEPVATPPVATPPVESGPSFWTKLREIPIGRPLGIAASMVVVLAMLLGGAVYMSQDSVPGDALYGLKRASERVELATASDDAERAQDHLDFAAERVNEARTLLSRATASAAGTGVLADGGVSAETAARIVQGLRDADADTRTASQLLGDLAVRHPDANSLDAMTRWAPSQLDRLKSLWSRMPAGSLRDNAGDSTQLVSAAAQRARALNRDSGRSCTSAGSDSLGPKPCRSARSAAPGSAGKKTTKPERSARSTTPSRNARNSAPAGNGATTRSTQSPTKQTTSPGTTGATPKVPLLPLPTIKLPTRTNTAPPVQVGSCVNVLDVLKLGKCRTTSP